MSRYRVNAGFMVPHYVTMILETDSEEQAEEHALAVAAAADLDYKPDYENSEPIQAFDLERVCMGLRSGCEQS